MHVGPYERCACASGLEQKVHLRKPFVTHDACCSRGKIVIAEPLVILDHLNGGSASIGRDSGGLCGGRPGHISLAISAKAARVLCSG
jgi:hypothetical protein